MSLGTFYVSEIMNSTVLYSPFYREISLRKMGNVFLICISISLICVVSSYAFGKETILLAPEPTPLPLPPPGKHRDLKYFRNLKKQRLQKKKNKQKLKKPTQSPDEQKLIDDALKKTSYHVMAQTTFVYPVLQTSGPRKNYTTDLTNHFSMYMRPSRMKDEKNSHFWGGFRLAPFSGSGQYEETIGRYSFLYFGPVLAFGGLIAPSDTSDSPLTSQAESKLPKKMPIKSAWMITGGISVQTRIAHIDPTDEYTDVDLNTTRGANIDIPGIWVELIYSKIYFGGFGGHYVTGVQLGEGKKFFWFGLGAGAWY